MAWQSALLTRLRANAGVTALIGTKSYWDEIPQGTTRPYLLLEEVTDLRPQTLTAWDLAFARVQLTSVADTKAESVSVIEAAVAALVPGHTTGGHTFQRADVELMRSLKGARDGTNPVRGQQADLTFYYT